MKKLLILLFSIFISFNALSDKVPYKYYKKNLSSYDDYLIGLESGISWSTIMNDELGSEVSFYCPPETLSITLENVKDIIDSEVEQIFDAGGTQAEVDELPIGAILVFGLRRMFPCN